MAKLYRNYGKNLFDLVLSIFSITLLLPFFFVIGFAIKIDSSGPVFFFQDRVGKNGKIFKLIKFRTMIDKKRVPSKEIYQYDNELTSVGKWLRRFKIDETPQLLNVLRGNLSFVGPRPCLESLIKDFDDNAYSRLEVKPGLTGLAQISGNIYLSWPERWKLDKHYVETYSFFIDLRILMKTLKVVIFGEDKFIVK